MRNLTMVALVATFFTAAAAPASADGFLTPFYGYNFGGDSNCPTIRACEDKRSNFGASFGTMGTVFGFLGHPSCLYALDPQFKVVELICDLVKKAGNRAALVDLNTVARRAKTR